MDSKSRTPLPTHARDLRTLMIDFIKVVSHSWLMPALGVQSVARAAVDKHTSHLHPLTAAATVVSRELHLELRLHLERPGRNAR